MQTENTYFIYTKELDKAFLKMIWLMLNQKR